MGDAGTERLRDARRQGTAGNGQGAEAVELAELRLRGLAPRAVDVLERLLTAESEAVALGAARDLTDRAVGKATEKFNSRPKSSSIGRGDYEVVISSYLTRPIRCGSMMHSFSWSR